MPADLEAAGGLVSGLVRGCEFSGLTSSKRPSIFSCHAGIPWPVSKFGGSAALEPDVSDCHACPETVCDRKRRNVRVVCVERPV